MEDRELVIMLLDHGADMHRIVNEYQDIDSAFNQALLNGTLHILAFFLTMEGDRVHQPAGLLLKVYKHLSLQLSGLVITGVA